VNNSSQSTFGMINCIKELKSILSLRPFTPENCDALYAMRNGSCNLVLKDEPRDKPPYSLDRMNISRLGSLMSCGICLVFQSIRWISLTEII
jgi:hypothetical protein